MKNRTFILDISVYYNNNAACLLKDGKIIAAAQEEKFTRKKHNQTFPTNSFSYCLDHVGIKGMELDYVAFYNKSFFI